MIEPLRITIDVNCPADHAFRVWTNRIATWWPQSHTVSGEAGSRVVLEERLGGRIFEATLSGREIDWGEITAWEPPHRLAYLWHIRRDRADATDVNIRFLDLGGATRVEIVHSGWERLGDGQSWRDANLGGWSGLLPQFVVACGPDSPV